MATNLQGNIVIPKQSYEGSGEAILFINKSRDSDGNYSCDKIIYLKNIEGAKFDDDGNVVSVPEDFSLDSDKHHDVLKVIMSSWQAVIPSLGIHYDLKESEIDLEQDCENDFCL